jgi:hypothetical protein
LRTNTKRYGGKTHYSDSQNSDTTTPTSRDMYNLQFSLQEASPETFGYTLLHETLSVINSTLLTVDIIPLCMKTLVHKWCLELSFPEKNIW